MRVAFATVLSRRAPLWRCLGPRGGPRCGRPDRGRWRLAAMVGVLCAVWATPVMAKVPLCARFLGPTLKHPAEYQRLLELELRHHPTHHLVRRGCQAELIVEYLQLDTGGLLTARLRGGIPHRVRVSRLGDLPARLGEVVTFVLRHEPVYLVENLETSGLVRPPRLSLLRHGVSLYALGLAQAWVFVRAAHPVLPQVLFRYRRTVDRWFLGVVASFAWNPRSLPRDEEGHLGLDRPFVRFVGAARLEAGIALFPRAWATLFVSGLFGVSFLQVYHHPPDSAAVDDLVGALAEVSLRAGVELFRLHRTRLSCYGQVDVPLHKLVDRDYGLIDAYTPSLSVGCEVAF